MTSRFGETARIEKPFSEIKTTGENNGRLGMGVTGLYTNRDDFILVRLIVRCLLDHQMEK